MIALALLCSFGYLLISCWTQTAKHSLHDYPPIMLTAQILRKHFKNGSVSNAKADEH